MLQECNDLGIKGKNISQELAQLQQQLPGLFQEALADISSPAITAAMEHYAAFTAYAHAPASAAAEDPNSLLDHMHSIRSCNQAPRCATDAADAAQSNHGDTDSAKGLHDEHQWDITVAADDSHEAPDVNSCHKWC